MGEVFRAVDPRLKRTVAIKLLHGDAARAPAARQRFEREARAIAALAHPNICVVYDYDIDEAWGQPYLVMEHLEGETLQDRLERGPLPPSEIVAMGAALADALDTAHAVGIIHRDIKPANVFVTARGQPKLMDFGIAKIAASESAPTATGAGLLTVEGAAIGTIAYMSPEQARGLPIDARTDVFSLGVMLYEMATGVRPFAGATEPLICDAILNREPAPITALRPEVPAALEAVIADTLTKDRDRRLPSAAVLRDRLRAIGPTRAGEPDDRPTAAALLRATPRRRRGLAGAVAAGLIGALVAGVVFSRSGGDAPPVANVRSLAVLPFNAAAASDAREALHGLAASLADRLAREPELTVIAGARTAPFEARGEPAETIARSLGADAALETRAAAQPGDRLQIDAAVVTASGQRIWSAAYNRPRAELYAVEQTLADDLARALNLTSMRGATAANPARPVDPRVYDLYLRSRYHLGRWNEAELASAIAMLEQATAIDPEFGPAQALLAIFYSVMSFNYRPNESEWRSKGHSAVEKALALDPKSAEAHYARGILIWQPSEAWPHRAALDEFRQALARQPNLDDAWHHRGVVLMHIGHLDRAEEFYERALALNPVNTQARFRLAPLRNYQQRYEDAILVMRRVPQEVYPSQWTYHMGWSLVALNRLSEAAQQIDAMLAKNRADQGGVMHATRALLRAKTGDRRGAEADIAAAIDAGRGFGHFHHTALTIGEVYAQLGDLERAQQWVENAANDGFPNYKFFEVDPHLAPLRATERFRRYLAQLRAEWEHIGVEDDDPRPR
jgi:tetratricopeptide (TPR) repeat protein